MAVTIDGVKKDEMPSSPKISDDSYYKVEVECPNSDTMAEWDYNAWKLKLSYVESNSKCTLKFTSGMSKSDYEEYIKSGVALRRNTYRGKDITDLWKSGELYNQIKDGTFADIYVGDYIKGNKGVTWLIADLDNYLNIGNQGNGLQTHHATIIPDGNLMTTVMNQKKEEMDTTEGGYAGSEMITTLDETILTSYIIPDFDTHVLEYQNLLSTNVDDARSNPWGSSDGASSAWEWKSRKLDLMSEVNVYGTTIWSSSGYDIGIDNQQYAIFQLRPELINKTMSGTRFNYWLKAVAASTSFAYVNGNGSASPDISSGLRGVRPRFLID